MYGVSEFRFTCGSVIGEGVATLSSNTESNSSQVQDAFEKAIPSVPELKIIGLNVSGIGLLNSSWIDVSFNFPNVFRCQ